MESIPVAIIVMGVLVLFVTGVLMFIAQRTKRAVSPLPAEKSIEGHLIAMYYPEHDVTVFHQGDFAGRGGVLKGNHTLGTKE